MVRLLFNTGRLHVSQFTITPSSCLVSISLTCHACACHSYNINTFTLERVLTGHARSITSLTWYVHALLPLPLPLPNSSTSRRSRRRDDLFATCANDGRVIVWSAATGTLYKSIEMTGGVAARRVTVCVLLPQSLTLLHLSPPTQSPTFASSTGHPLTRTRLQ